MKKMILPLLVLVTAFSFTLNANASGIASKVKKIHCDFRGSESVYSFTTNTITHAGRSTTDVTPMLSVQIDDVNDSIVVASKRFGSIAEDLFKITGQPYKPGFDDKTVFVAVRYNSYDCTGLL